MLETLLQQQIRRLQSFGLSCQTDASTVLATTLLCGDVFGCRKEQGKTHHTHILHELAYDEDILE